MAGDDVVLQFDRVRFDYRGDWLQRVQALEDISFSVERGDCFGFLGANGAGKSTSIKLLTGLLTGHEGRIELFGEGIGDPRLRRRIGYLPEQPFFYENLKLDEYLYYLGRLSGLRTQAARDARERVYELLDLGELRDRQLGSFSKGMRQRFGLAQAILHQPDLLVLDEPFSGLDPLWRSRFREVLIAERERGATLFFSSHILSDVEDVCDGYAIIDHGVILDHGHLSELLDRAPLLLIGSGPAPEAAEPIGEDGQWRWLIAEDERESALARVRECGGTLLRLERQRQALEDYFVRRVAEFHGTRRAAPSHHDAGGAP